MVKMMSAAVVVSLFVAGCAEQSAVQLAQDTVRLHISTAPIYAALEPQRRASLMAAQETVKRGYDKFIVVDNANGYKPNVIGFSPAQYQSTGSANVVGNDNGFAGSSQSRSTYTGAAPVAMPRFESDTIIKMFKVEDPAGANAFDARQILAQNKPA